MSKDLEKEYRELIAEDVPDLWDRIEAGLEMKKSAKDRAGRWKRYGLWGTAAAACLCLVVAAPFLFGERIEQGGGSYAPQMDSNDAASYSGSPAEEADFGSAFESTESGYGEGAGTTFQGQSASAPAEEDLNYVYVAGKVTTVTEAEDRWVYAVEIEWTDLEEYSEGEVITLYGEEMLTETAVEGETYMFELSVLTEGDGLHEYLIEDVWLY